MTEIQSPLLRLTPGLRSRIYQFLDIESPDGRPRFIYLPVRTGPLRPGGDRWYFKHAYALLLCCRTIYAEISAVVYGTNHIFAQYTEHDGLGSLWRLRPSSIQALSQLTVHLHAVTCGLGRVCPYPLDSRALAYGVDIEHYYDKPMPRPVTTLEAPHLFSEWHRVWCTHLRPNLQPMSKLELDFVCDVDNHESGQRAVAPFLEGPHAVIAGCSIRLGHRRDPHLEKLARAAARRLVGSTDEPKTRGIRDRAQFFNLPKELRLKVLENTDLVTPFREVEWNPQHGYYLRRCEPLSADDPNDPENAHGSLSSSDTGRDAMPIKYSPLRGCSAMGSSAGCFCRSHHSTYSTSRYCQCWAAPTPLFQVSKQFRIDAIEVFFSGNRFTVIPQPMLMYGTIGTNEVVGRETSSPKLFCSVFLSRTLPSDGLRYLRWLELVFESTRAPYSYRPCPAAIADWVSTLDSVMRKLNLRGLTIIAHFAPTRTASRASWARQAPELARERALDKYLVHLLPLQRLEGLGRFIAFLPDPTVDDSITRLHSPTYVEEWANQIEKAVMGDAYNAPKVGKLYQDPFAAYWEEPDCGSGIELAPCRWFANHVELD